MKNLLLLSMIILLNGCIGAAVGTAVATTAAVVAEERTAGDVVDDTTIFWHIKHLYIQENARDLLAGVNVEVIQGRVHLTGIVDSTEARIDAVRLAWRPEGVTEVINEINIRDHETKIKDIVRDQWIKSQVKSRMLFEKGVKSINYSVDSVNGVVYLMGIAQDKNELDKVTHVTSMVKGVTKVISHVRLKDELNHAKR